MLIRRRLETIRKLVTEYNLSVDAVLVTSNCNLTDRLTRVPQRWYDAMKKEAGPVPLLCAASVEAAEKQEKRWKRNERRTTEREREREKMRVRKRRRKVEEERKEESGVARNPQAL